MSRGAAPGRTITPDEAIRIVLDHASPLPAEELPFIKTLGRVLAEPVTAQDDLPPFDRSAMDGFAVRSADAAVMGAVLTVVREIPAGAPAGARIGAGEAARIMTGAPIPPGADAVQMQEETEPADTGRRVRLLKPVAAGENVRRRGADVAAGQRLLEPGTRIRAHEVALLATLGVVNPRVHSVPRIAILSTGDEIVEPDQAPLPHQIRNSNAYLLRALASGMRIGSTSLGIAADDPEALRERIRSGLDTDLLLMTGGVSVGAHDHVAGILREEGAEILFHGVSVKPGKPLLFAARGRTLIFGLPGNPLSTAAMFGLFVAPAIRALRGEREPLPARVRGTLTGDLRQKPGRTWFALVSARFSSAGWQASPMTSTGSGDLAAACRANAFAVVPDAAEHLPAGAPVELILWGEGTA